MCHLHNGPIMFFRFRLSPGFLFTSDMEAMER